MGNVSLRNQQWIEYVMGTREAHPLALSQGSLAAAVPLLLQPRTSLLLRLTVTRLPVLTAPGRFRSSIPRIAAPTTSSTLADRRVHKTATWGNTMWRWSDMLWVASNSNILHQAL